MKHFSLLVVLLLVTFVTGNSQSTLIATLTHDDVITTYTGSSGLQDAYNAAVDGDIITLSSGSFKSQDIEKRITLRGAGMGVKVNADAPYIEPTYLVGAFHIYADGNSENRTKIEGVTCEERVWLGGVCNAVFSKCKFDDLDYTTGKGGFENVTVINCVLSGMLCFNASMNFYGSYLKNLHTQAAGSLHTVTNCILESDGNCVYSGCVVKNSIHIVKVKNCSFNCQSFFSLWTGEECPTSSDFYKNFESHNNTFGPDGMQLFKDGTFYQLTDEAKKYVGDDGTEVGIYGGSIPFDPTPTNPQITKFNVAPKTTADGKLSIDIEVNAK